MIEAKLAEKEALLSNEEKLVDQSRQDQIIALQQKLGEYVRVDKIR